MKDDDWQWKMREIDRDIDLTDTQRKLIRLGHGRGLSVKQISKRVGVDVHSVRSITDSIAKRDIEQETLEERLLQIESKLDAILKHLPALEVDSIIDLKEI